MAKRGVTNSLPPETQEEVCTVAKVMQCGNRNSYRASKGKEEGPGGLAVKKYKLSGGFYLFKYFTLEGGLGEPATNNDTDITHRRKANTSEERENDRGILWQIVTAEKPSDVSWAYRVKFLAKAKKKGQCTYVWAVMSCCILRSGDIETNPGPSCDSSDSRKFADGAVEAGPIRGPVLSVLGRLGRLVDEDGGVVNLLLSLVSTLPGILRPTQGHSAIARMMRGR